jgi:hyperosmotically inducible protein
LSATLIGSSGQVYSAGQSKVKNKYVASQDQSRETRRLVKEIRHELLTLPWYGVFDWLEGTVGPNGVVTLRGWVTRPTTKSDAEARVKEIEGVTSLHSEIKVLPLSPNDDRIRRAVYFALFGNDSPLFRYALGANPTIHIIVENGRVTLKGSVSSEADRNMANIKARGVSGVFEVRNELAVE